MTDAFHQAAVTEEYIGVVINDLKAGPIEFGSQQMLRQRHTHRVGDALTQWTGGGFNARCDVDFRMTRRQRMQLPKVANLVHRQRITRQMQQGIQQHGTMTIGDNEAIAVHPFGIRRIVPQMFAPQRNGDIGHAHGHAGMSRVGFLNSIHRERADCICHFAGVRTRVQIGSHIAKIE